MMDKLEKVLKGLQCCNTWSCAGLYEGYQPDYDACIECPFRCDPIDPEECHKKLLDYAITLLKVQEPRVMTVEEITKADVVWLECYGICSNLFKAALPGHPLNINDATWDFQTHPYTEVMFLVEYGKNWRCWTSKPTDEQRKATPWTS